MQFDFIRKGNVKGDFFKLNDEVAFWNGAYLAEKGSGEWKFKQDLDISGLPFPLDSAFEARNDSFLFDRTDIPFYVWAVLKALDDLV